MAVLLLATACNLVGNRKREMPSKLVAGERGATPSAVLPFAVVVERAREQSAQLRERARRCVEPGSAPLERLIADADFALAAAPPTVTANSAIAPKGGPNDFYQVALYWHPNENGEFEWRDGQFNPDAMDPEINDGPLLDQFVYRFEALALAGVLLEDPDYTEQAARYLRVWFLEPGTRMNPSLAYGDMLGTSARHNGIVRTRALVRLLRALPWVQASPYWTPEDERGLRTWFAEYRDWLLYDLMASNEFRAPNNHGIWYDAELIAYSDYLGDEETARNFLRHLQERMRNMIDVSGEQTIEVARKRSYFYSCYTLQAYFAAAPYGDRLGVDMWRYPSETQSLLRTALEFLVPYIDRDAAWPHVALDRFEDSRRELLPLLLEAAEVFPDASFDVDAEKLIATLGDDFLANVRERLIYPPSSNCRDSDHPASLAGRDTEPAIEVP